MVIMSKVKVVVMVQNDWNGVESYNKMSLVNGPSVEKSQGQEKGQGQGHG